MTQVQKEGLKQRLLAENRWAAAHGYRDGIRKDGMTVSESWWQMAGTFPPVQTRSPSEPTPQRIKEALTAIRSNEAVPNIDGENPDDPRGVSVLRSMAEELAVMARGRKSSIREVYSWIFENAKVPWDALVAEDVPSPGAIGLLQWVKSSAANLGKFYSDMHPKLAPSRSQLEAADRFTDDGRDLSDLIDRVQKAGVQSTAINLRLAAGAEG